MQRYFLDHPCPEFREKKIKVTGEQYHHMSRVMRMKVGEQVFIVLPNQLSFVATITDIEEDHLLVKWVQDEETEKELPIFVTVASGLPKGDKLEWIVKKGTELGAKAFIPFNSEFSIVKWSEKKRSKKVERLKKIAQEAAEQSHRTVIPEINYSTSIEQVIRESKKYDACLVAYEENAKKGEKKQFPLILKSLKPGDSLLVLFGPEGGLSTKEITVLLENEFVPCALGPRILRTETAPLYVLSAVSYEFELKS